MSETLPEQQTNLQLGDIISLDAPMNSDIHDRVFLIKYIDKEQISLVDEETLEEVVLAINDDGNLTDESIEGIAILDRVEEPGYAKQQGLVPNEWINLYFGGEVPAVITGQITDQYEDLIEIKTFPDGETIYIDFAYKGIPKDLPLERIELREKPTITDLQEKFSLTPMEERETEQLEEPEIEVELAGDQIVQIPVPDVKAQIKEMFLAADQIEIGVDLGIVEQMDNVAKGEERYSIEKQRDDLKDELLSTIPNTQRTQSVLNNIDKLIQRFTLLRQQFSEFDKQGNVERAKIHGADHKPLVETLVKLNKNLIWLLPIAKNRKILFDVDSPEETGLDDYETVTMSVRLEDNANVMTSFKNNELGTGANKYDELISQLYNVNQAFTQPLRETDVITTKTVEDNITAVIDNLENFGTSIVKSQSQLNAISAKKYLITKYDLGINRLKLERERTGREIIAEQQIVRPQQISIKGVMTLPYQLTYFSRATMPRTNIMVRSNLARHYIGYWQVLRKNADVTVIDNLDNEINYDKKTFLSQIRAFFLDETIDEPNKYQKFLDSIMPRTRVLFELVKRHLKNAYSLSNILEYLEPFQVYHSDLSFKQYESMTGFIRGQIKDYKKSLAVLKKEMQYIQSFNVPLAFSFNLISALIGGQLQEKDRASLFMLYNLASRNPDGYDVYTPRTELEQLQDIIKSDNGRAYTSALSSALINLMVPDTDTLADLNEDIQEAKRELMSLRQRDSCDKYTLSKKYISLDELEDDNDVDVYFDRQFDKTNYKLADKYKQERKDMGEQNFIRFLTDEISKAQPELSVSQAEREAIAIVTGKRLVEEGDFAVLISDDENGNQKLQNFTRSGNRWIQSEVTESLLPTIDMDALCASQESCIPSDNVCEDVNAKTVQQEVNTLKESIKFFAELYPRKRQQLSSYINDRLQKSVSSLKTLDKLQKEKFEKYSLQRYNLGLTSEDYQTPDSPYATLRDLILSQGDFVKRQYDIIRFKTQFTYENLVSDDPSDSAWLYCNVTGVRLLPSFLYTLAYAFVYEPDSYVFVLEKLCKEIGTESDDGENWVDKYTGYVIRPKQFDTEEGYTQDGYKMKTREVMESQLGSAVYLQQDKPKKYSSAEAELVARGVRAVATLMGVDMSAHEDFIIRNVLLKMKQTMPAKEDYEKEMARRAAKQEKKVKLPSYKDAFNAKLLLLTFAYYLVAIQSSIPPIVISRTFPGCRIALHGYPIDGDQDKSAVTYIACLAQSLKKTKVEPWNAIASASEAAIVKQVVAIIDTQILTDPDIIAMFNEKKAYIKEQAYEEIPSELDVRQWVNFLPPLVRPKPPTIEPLADSFKQTFAKHLKQGSSEQFVDIDTLRTRIRDFSIQIQELVARVVNGDKALLKLANAAFLTQNACCDTTTTGCYDYFVERQPDIERLNKAIRYMTQMLDEAGLFAKAPMLFDPKDTRIRYPPLGRGFAEQTIIQAFIVYCRFTRTLPIAPELLPVCKAKPEELDVGEPITEAIKKLQRAGRVYTKEALDSLMAIVNKRNIVYLDLDPVSLTKVQQLRDLTQSLATNDESIIDRNIAKGLFDILDVFSMESPNDIENSELRKLRNSLFDTTQNNRTYVEEFLKENGAIGSKSLFKKITEFLKAPVKLLETSPTSLVSAKDTATFRSIVAGQNMLRVLCAVLPNMLINNVIATNPTIPKYWGFSQNHNSDLTKFFEQHYGAFEAFYRESSIASAMESYMAKTRILIDLADSTTYLAPKPEQEETSSVLDSYTVNLLMEYFISLALKTFVDSSSDERAITMSIEANQNREDNIEMWATVTADREAGESVTSQMLAGERRNLQEKIGKLLSVVIEMLMSDKSNIDYSYESVMEQVLKIKRKERDEFATITEGLSDEERQLTMLFKKAKLGEWGKGLQKGLTQYVAETYDMERERGEQELINRKQVKQREGVNDMNEDIMIQEMLQERQYAEIEERDAYDMTAIGEDDDEGYDNDNYEY